METLERDNLTGENHAGDYANNPLRILTATSIMKDEVVDPAGEKLGEIRDIMLNVRTGKIEYIVMECGGFLGIGEKLFAVPFNVLRIDTNNHAFVFDQDKDVLKNAPGFDKTHWPETNNHDYRNYNTYWGSFMGANTGSVPY